MKLFCLNACDEFIVQFLASSISCFVDFVCVCGALPGLNKLVYYFKSIDFQVRVFQMTQHSIHRIAPSMLKKQQQQHEHNNRSSMTRFHWTNQSKSNLNFLFYFIAKWREKPIFDYSEKNFHTLSLPMSLWCINLTTTNHLHHKWINSLSLSLSLCVFLSLFFRSIIIDCDVNVKSSTLMYTFVFDI